MDSVRVHYSNDGGASFTYIGQTEHPAAAYSFSIPFGVTDSGQVKLVAVDIYGNEGEGTSDYFTITDNTPPEVSVYPPGNVYISDTLWINWEADDNTGIAANDIYFSNDSGLTFTLIDTAISNAANNGDISGRSANASASVNRIMPLNQGKGWSVSSLINST